MFGFARAVYDASHNGDFHFFNADVFFLPQRHLLTQIVLDIVGHFLEERAGGASTAGACGYLRAEAANFKRLQNLLGYENLFGAISVRHRRKRGANRIADSFLQKHANAGCGSDHAFGPQAGFGQAYVEGEIAAGRKMPVDFDQILNTAHLGADDDLIGA